MTGNTACDCKSVIVTGGGGMIGRVTVEHLAVSGCDVLAVDVNAAALAELAKGKRSSGRISTFVADVVDPAQMAAATAKATALFGTIDAFVNIAGALDPQRRSISKRLIRTSGIMSGRRGGWPGWSLRSRRRR